MLITSCEAILCSLLSPCLRGYILSCVFSLGARTRNTRGGGDASLSEGEESPDLLAGGETLALLGGSGGGDTPTLLGTAGESGLVVGEKPFRTTVAGDLERVIFGERARGGGVGREEGGRCIPGGGVKPLPLLVFRPGGVLEPPWFVLASWLGETHISVRGLLLERHRSELLRWLERKFLLLLCASTSLSDPPLLFSALRPSSPPRHFPPSRLGRDRLGTAARLVRCLPCTDRERPLLLSSCTGALL